VTSPNIVLIISDDQPKGLMDAMPFVREHIKDAGMSLINAIAPTALCSPARASILTGNLSNKTGVWTNELDGHGAWPAFGDRENDTLATRLQSVGYHTALFGKYINKFSDAPDGYIPSGWNEFVTMFSGQNGAGAGSYYEYTLKGTITPEYHGSTPEDYSTDVLRDKAVTAIQSAPQDKPLFLYFAPWGPHDDYEAAERHKGTWLDGGELPGSFNEQDMTDKPEWMQDLPEADRDHEIEGLRKMHEVVMSVDEAVEAIFTALGDRADNTIVIYMSDNGKMLGSHRLIRKDLAYRWASEVPVFVRWTNFLRPGESFNRVTPNVDITAFIAESAGVTGWQIDGKSFMSTLRAGTPMMQMDNYKDQKHPGYIGYRTARYLFVQYTNGMGEEFYDYQTDPNELNNLINSKDPDVQDRISKHRVRANSINPRPPGFIPELVDSDIVV
jgi:N-acetylglucosamine-6-sulfatase